jgi:hypothetical protein
MGKKNDKPVPNVSGTFQIADDSRQADLNEAENLVNMDEESMYYARLFMED